MRIEPLRMPFDLALSLPGSKSHANRAIVAAALASGRTILEGATPCDDVSLLVSNLQRLGFDLDWVPGERDTLRVQGGLPGATPGEQPHSAPVELFCGNAGTALRFLTAVACLVPGQWIVTGSERMCKRPIGELTAALALLGVELTDSDGCPPVRIRGGNLKGGATRLDASKSSQFLTALMLIGPALPLGLRIELQGALTSPTYVELTEQLLADFGAETRRDGGLVRVSAFPYDAPARYAIEGDWSAAGAYHVLAALTGSRFHGLNLRAQSTQGDRRLPALLDSLGRSGDCAIDCTPIPDQLMNLAVFAAGRRGTTRLYGAANLRHKECDRLAVITNQLRLAGVDIEQTEDGVIVHGPATPQPARLDPHADHRMAMAFSILGALAPGLEVLDPACVSKSYPAFFEDWRQVTSSPRCVVVTGMRGAGKSTFARDLALALDLECVDTDDLFVARHGEIGAFVETHGWRSFREREEQLVREALARGGVVALGGGAVESERTRERLSAALVVWLQEQWPTLVERLLTGDRPALTELDLGQEVRQVLKRREPLYEEVSRFQVPPGLTREARVAMVLDFLRSCCSLGTSNACEEAR